MTAYAPPSPRTHKRLESISIRLSSAELDRLEALAWERRQSRAAIARDLLLQALDHIPD